MENQGDDIVEIIASEEEDKDEGTPIYRIASYPSDLTLEGLHMKWKREEIEIPGLQRGWVWTHTQASRLIESFLLGLPVPGIFVYRERLTEKQLVIDGQQRLRSIFGFFEGKLPDGGDFFLKGVDPLWEGNSIDKLTDAERIRLRDSVLRVMVVEQIDPHDDTSIYHIFERLNTGGTGLTPQEVRNCTFHGPFNDLLHELNQNTLWRSIFGTTVPDHRMRDMELILRFLGLYEARTAYSKPMKQFLNNFMAKHQRDQSLENQKSIFADTVQRVINALGPRPFHIKRGINAAVFDSVMVAFAAAQTTPGDLNERFHSLLANPSYAETIAAGTTDVEIIIRRIELARHVLFG